MVEDYRQSADFIAAFHFGTDGQVAFGGFLHGESECFYRFIQLDCHEIDKDKTGEED